MEHGNSSRGSYVGLPGEGDGVPSRYCLLNPGAASSSGYGQAQNAVSWGVPTLVQEAREELAIVKAVVTSLEEEAVLTHSQRTESNHRYAGERSAISLFCLFDDMISDI
jgi:hypothetical protein